MFFPPKDPNMLGELLESNYCSSCFVHLKTNKQHIINRTSIHTLNICQNTFFILFFLHTSEETNNPVTDAKERKPSLVNSTKPLQHTEPASGMSTRAVRSWQVGINQSLFPFNPGQAKAAKVQGCQTVGLFHSADTNPVTSKLLQHKTKRAIFQHGGEFPLDNLQILKIEAHCTHRTTCPPPGRFNATETMKHCGSNWCKTQWSFDYHGKRDRIDVELAASFNYRFNVESRLHIPSEEQQLKRAIWVCSSIQWKSQYNQYVV